MVIKSVVYCCIYHLFAVVWCCAWNLSVLTCFCFCRSSGCALDCCPLSRHCPLDPKAVWLPLQATVPMATFHSHLFSIWLWHIHIDINAEITVNNNHAPARTGRKKFIFTVFKFYMCCLASDPSIERVWTCICQMTPYVSVVGPVGFRGVVLWCEWSGYSYPLSSHDATLHDFIFRFCAT